MKSLISTLAVCATTSVLADSQELPANTTPAPTQPTLTASVKKQSMPHMELLSPIKRRDVDPNRLSLHPCGGTKTGPVHYETTPGSRNLVAWRIHTPSPTGRCMIRVSDSPIESDMVIAKPTDGSAAEDGSFPCGREITSFEAKEIKIPRDLICDTCLIQLVWLTEEGDQYRCVDFQSVASEVPECFGQCLNGGICRNGRCACPKGFSGSNCQYEEETEEGQSVMEIIMDDSVILLIYGLMLAVIIGLFVAAYFLYKRVRDQRAEAVPLNDVAASDKLTSNQAEPVGGSRFDRYDD